MSEVWVEIPEHLVVRMVDIVTALAHGHDGLFLMAEAVHLSNELDKLLVEPVYSGNDPEDDCEE